MSIYYPTPSLLTEYNLLALAVLKVKKADKAAVLSKPKLFDIKLRPAEKKKVIFTTKPLFY